LMTAGAPLKNSRADPWGASSDRTTAPDLKVSELNPSTFMMDSFTVLEADLALGRRGKTTVCLSCMCMWQSTMVACMLASLLG